MIVLLVLIAIFIVVLLINAKIVPQSYAYVIERIGQYHTTWESGFHIAIPILDRISKKISLKEQVIDFPPQPVITKDNVTISIDSVVYLYIVDPKLYVYGVERPKVAIENLTATTLRNIIGDMELDQTLTSRDTINTELRSILDEATDPWGIKINRVELKNIMPPKEIQDAMERQMKAERERREAILRAEGEKRSAILVAEGSKQSMILNAQAEKEAVVLRADAARQARILQAEGEAEAILKLKNAEAQGITYLEAAKPTSAILQLRSYEALEKVANGKSTKLIIPSEIQNLTAVAAALKETVDDTPSAEDKAVK